MPDFDMESSDSEDYNQSDEEVIVKLDSLLFIETCLITLHIT